MRHLLLIALEAMLALGRQAPRLANGLSHSPWGRRIAERAFGLVDLPRFSTAPRKSLPLLADPAKLATLSPEERSRTVVLVEDSFTSTFDISVVLAASMVLSHLGYRVLRLPARANGKALHGVGLRERFARLARRRVRERAALAIEGVRLIGLDAATSLMYEQEYREVVPASLALEGLETFLGAEIAAGRLVGRPLQDAQAYHLLSHCTESALRPEAAGQWRDVLQHFGIVANPVRTGCCGMAGMFGHEADHAHLSRRLFDLSWRDALGQDPQRVLATGFSCRCQAKRFGGHRPRHPIELLLSQLSTRPAP